VSRRPATTARPRATPYGMLSASAARGRLRPEAYEPVTRAQARWLAMTGKQLLWRAANQVGKSRGLAKKLIQFITASGVYAGRSAGPVKVLVLSISKEQMEPLHQKLWELLPKDQIDLASTEYVPGFGFRGKPPRITFTAGAGAGSVIVFATYKQGSTRIAGGTFDVVACDEPLPERVYGEALARTLHGRPGELWITFTPTPDSPPLAYLREKVEAGEVKELHTPLTVENVTLSTGRPLKTAAEIDAYSKLVLAAERDMRLNGGWEIVTQDRLLDNWGPHCVAPVRLMPGALLAIGVDHGTGAGRQTAALVQLQLADRVFPKVDLLAESRSKGFSTPEQDAEAILTMLRALGLRWEHVDAWFGDRATNFNKSGIRKTNKDLHIHLARLVGVGSDAFPRIEVPNKAGGTVTYGYRLMNAIMGRRDEAGVSHFRVNPAALHFRESCDRYNGRNPKDPLKDMLDAVRYPIEELIKPREFSGLTAIY
jgi:phage terminase large subunit-like protein